MLVDAAEHFPAKINSTSSTVAVRCIKEKLTEAQLSIFRTTCFGKLIEMKDLKFSGQLVHNLLLRQIQSPVKSEDDSADVRKNIVKLPLCEASRAWFKTLYTPDEWLNDEHIDSAFHWIRQVKSDSPTTKMEICTTTDVLFQQMLDARFQRYTNGEDLWCEDDRLFDYAKGLSPKLGTPWIETDKVYIPLNYMSKHWILAEIVFSARKIIVYDSEVNFIGSGKKLKKFMEPLSTLLPLLLHAIDFFSKRPEIHHREDMSPWLVEQCGYVPHQEKSDCGVFVIKFAEHLIHGQSIDSVQVKQAQYFRQQLCLSLWRSRLIE